MLEFEKAYKQIKHLIGRRMANAHIAGSTLDEALGLCRQIARRGWSTTICPWTDSCESLETIIENYRSSICSIAQEHLDCRISVKIPDQPCSFEMLKQIFDLAQQQRVYIQFDAAQPEQADRTFRMIEKALETCDSLGCTLPSRWRRSIDDVEHAIRLGLRVRVVKGQWSDALEPGRDSRLHFLQLIEMLAGRAVHVSVATHDRPLAEKSLLRLVAAKTPCELEQLVGIPLSAASKAQSLGVPIRVYVPFGHPYLPYNLSDWQSRPAVLAWALRDIVVGKEHKFAHFMNGNKQFSRQFTMQRT